MVSVLLAELVFLFRRVFVTHPRKFQIVRYLMNMVVFVVLVDII